MLALEEKSRAVVIIKPDLLLKASENEVLEKGKEQMTTGKTLADDICAKFEEEYLEVKARKQVFMAKEQVEAFFDYMSPTDLQATVDSFGRGLCEVVVLEHLDDDIIDRAPKLVQELQAQYTGESNVSAMFCSSTPWECMYYLEFFFPHLASLPLERTLAIIKPDGIAAGTRKKITLEEDAEAKAAAAGLLVVSKQKVTVTAEQAKIVCTGCDDPKGSEGVLTSQPGGIAMILEGPGAINRWQLICGPPNSGTARDVAPSTLRACWGTDGTSNAVHASGNMASSEKEIKAFFPDGSMSMQRALCIIKPDAMDRLLQLRGDLQAAGFTILKEKEARLTEERAAEFYGKHKDEPYFTALVKEAASGPCVVMVLCRLEAVQTLQQLMGPASVKDAKRLRPMSLRARYGRDGQRNSVHGSDSIKASAYEVRFFFPEMGADPVPGDEEVRDFLFRKSAVASMELKNLSEADAAIPGYDPDPTLQQLLSQGLIALCAVQPRGKGLAAVKWLSRWLAENNPNKKAGAASAGSLPFEPPNRTTTYVQHGVNRDGLAFSVEPPQPAAKKTIIDVDVSEETQDTRASLADLTTPPHVVFVVGAEGSGSTAACTKLREEFNFVHLNMKDLYREEVSSGTYLGTEVMKHETTGTLHSDDGLKVTISLLKKAMLKHSDTNRFLMDGFPANLKEAKAFEQQVSSVSFIMQFDAAAETLKTRVEAEGGAFDENKCKDDQANVAQILSYYGRIGKVRKVNAEKKADEVYGEAKRYLSCRFVYLLGAPGAPVDQIAAKMESKYGYSAISLSAVLARYVQSGAEDAAKVKQALSKGKPVDASIVCPLIVSEVFRDMALGVQNFVLTDFPQTAKQAQFLEYRVPSIVKPMLLDFSRADAEDLAASGSGDALEIEMRTAEFFGAECQGMMQTQLSSMVKVPCSLAGVARATGAGRAEKIIDCTWSAVCPKVMPGLTIVLGPPCSGTDVLANLLAGLTPNTQAVDCNLLLDRELERKTEAGSTMHNMLARGQVVPLSMTLELLKDVVNITCSDSLVIENCPMYVDQIEYITQEFRIDRVFYIDGSTKAIDEWQKAFTKDGGPKESKLFEERVERLQPIVSHFARLGKLERIEVNTTPKETKLAEEVKKATMPQFAIVSGPSTPTTKNLASSLATKYGVGPSVTTDFLVTWAKAKLERTVDPADPKEFFSALKKYADATNFSLLVLERYPFKSEDAAEFVGMFGDPKVIMYVETDEDTLYEEFQAASEGQENLPEEDVKRAELQEMTKSYRGAFDEVATRCPSAALPVVKWDKETSNVEALVVQLCEKLRPRSYVIVAPSGLCDFGNAAAEKICTAKGDPAALPVKYSVVNSSELVKPARRSADLEDRLAKAAFAAEASDSLPVNLMVDLLKDSFATSANPMGTFLVTNYPTPCATAPYGTTIRDQFHLLEEASNVMGIFFVKMSDDAFTKLISPVPEDLSAYQALELQLSMHVNKEGKGQFDSHRVCEYVVESGDNVDDVLAKVAEEFQSFREKAEQAPK